MNILIVSDSFKKGGLETHIYTLYQHLKKSNKVYFAFSNYDDEYKLPKDKLFTGFHFGVNCTIKEFIEDVNNLVKIIKKNKIDVINIHPFYSIFPVMFAAHITNVKTTYTFHGTSSFNFTSSIVDTILFEYAFETTVKKTFCVSKHGIESFDTLNYHNSVWFPNPINLKNYRITKRKNDKRWALVTRLDDDKYYEISKLFGWLHKLDIDSIDIYGDGNRIEDLKKLSEKTGKNITFMGYSKDISKAIKDKYTGILGTGRAVLEGLAMNYPVILMGYGNILGMIDSQLYDSLKGLNFVAKFSNEVTLDKLQQQVKEVNSGRIEKYLFRDLVAKDFDVENLLPLYIKNIEEINFYPLQNVKDLFHKINDLIEFGDGDLPIYSSNNVYYILKNYIEHFTKNIVLKNLFIAYDKQVKNEYNLLKEIGRLNAEIDLINNKLNKPKGVRKWKKLR